MNLTSRFALAAALSVAALSAQANLVTQADGTVYDTALNISWMSNWNLGGLMTYGQAQNWITSLNAEDYDGHNDWMLPTTNTTASSNCDSEESNQQYYGSGCTGSEMGELFYNELGVTVGNSILTGNAADLALFTNVQSDVYWSGTVYAPNPSLAWLFNTYDGFQGYNFESVELYAVAVRAGDDGAAAATVPEPQVLALVLLGLGAAAVARRQRPR